jgi:glucose/arabinose dehydrogenase
MGVYLGRRIVRWCALGVALALASIATVAMVTNYDGLPARIIARLTRVDNDAIVVDPPPDFTPTVPHGFRVTRVGSGFVRPRWLAVAPNGDLFVADSGANAVVVLHHNGISTERRVFAEHLTLPFGVAFHDRYVYIANTDGLLRYMFDPTTSMRLGSAEVVLDLPGHGYNEHWTRSIAFSSDGALLYVSVGSRTNVSIESDPRRASILAVSSDGRDARVYAAGLRNAVGLAVNPQSGMLWATVNERDDVGDDEPDDYFTHVIEHGFYGWPYSYLGGHVDHRVSPRPDLVARAIVPDLAVGAHVAPLQFAFYDRSEFPAAYRHGAFIAEHGSWNSRTRRGYQVAFVPFRDGKPSGGVLPFLSGFVPDVTKREVYGRPVGVAIGLDGSLYVSDDGARTIWRITYAGS